MFFTEKAANKKMLQENFLTYKKSHRCLLCGASEFRLKLVSSYLGAQLSHELKFGHIINICIENYMIHKLSKANALENRAIVDRFQLGSRFVDLAKVGAEVDYWNKIYPALSRS
jgi:hypothetical protein